MIWHRKAKKWTAAESDRATRMTVEIGCIFCWLDEATRGPCEHRHHIKSGNKRMGHWYTLPVCAQHHRDCHNGRFGHAVQIDRWLKVQHILGLDDTLPRSKIVPRSVTTGARLKSGASHVEVVKTEMDHASNQSIAQTLSARVPKTDDGAGAGSATGTSLDRSDRRSSPGGSPC